MKKTFWRFHLVSMVKNEADVIERMMESYSPLGLNSIHIFDTGSTDNTIEKIKEYGIRHSREDSIYILEGEFVNYVKSKNELLRFAYSNILKIREKTKTSKNTRVNDVIIFSDADEYLFVSDRDGRVFNEFINREVWNSIRYHLEEILGRHNFISTIINDVDSNLEIMNSYNRQRFWVVPNDSEIDTFPYFNGPNVHEYIDSVRESHTYELTTINSRDFRIYHQHTDGKTDYSARMKSYIKFINDYIDEFGDSDVPIYMRGLFYLAQSYDFFDGLNANSAYKRFLDEYNKRNYIHRGEKYYSILKIGINLLNNNFTKESLTYFLMLLDDENKDEVERPEAYYYLAKLYYDFNIDGTKNIEKAIHYAKIGSEIKETETTGFFVDWRLRDYCKNMYHFFLEDLSRKNEQKTAKPLKLNDFFDEIYLINLDRRTDRLEVVSKKLDQFGIRYKRISAYDGELIDSIVKPIWNVYDSIEKEDHRLYADGCPSVLRSGSYTACSLSHLHCIKDAKTRGLEKILILEDDIYINKKLDSLFGELVESIGDRKWDVLYLGWLHYLWEEKEFINYNEDGSNRYREVGEQQLWACHAWAVHSQFYDTILDFYKKDFSREIDVFLNGYNMVWQYPHFKDIMPTIDRIYSPHHLFLPDFTTHSDNLTSDATDGRNAFYIDNDFTRRLNKFENVNDFI